MFHLKLILCKRCILKQHATGNDDESVNKGVLNHWHEITINKLMKLRCFLPTQFELVKVTTRVSFHNIIFLKINPIQNMYTNNKFPKLSDKDSYRLGQCAIQNQTLNVWKLITGKIVKFSTILWIFFTDRS